MILLFFFLFYFWSPEWFSPMEREINVIITPRMAVRERELEDDDDDDDDKQTLVVLYCL